MKRITFLFLCFIALTGCQQNFEQTDMIPTGFDQEIERLLSTMTLEEKIGQMNQITGDYGQVSEGLREAVRKGRIGSLINEVNPDVIREIQRIAREESRLGIPLLIGRDVIHGFKTIFPIPLGMAATWDSSICVRAAQVAAVEAASVGINWTFAPGVDICRDPRWGRVAESPGEDPYLASVIGRAMVLGFQGSDLSRPKTIAGCAKHFAGYGAAEGGRDYNTTNIPENELRNIFLPPFKACIDAGVSTVMSGFNELNGVPCSGNSYLMNTILKGEWGFRGFVVSDWESLPQMINHGFSRDIKEAALAGITAGIDMDMVSGIYPGILPDLVEEGSVPIRLIDDAVRAILLLKFQLGLFENPVHPVDSFPALANEAHQKIAQEAATKSCVLLKNTDQILPLNPNQPATILVTGPMADDAYEQMGTWIFDGEEKFSVSFMQAVRNQISRPFKVEYLPGLEYSRDENVASFASVRQAAQKADYILAFLGEESILSGEAHSRASIGLPGKQTELLSLLAQAGKPLITVILAGRPLTLEKETMLSDALLYAWHPGNMAGPALVDIIFGKANPSGKLPITFPKEVGQIPIYYNHKNTGKPATPETYTPIMDIPRRAVQYSLGNTSHYLDAGYTPLFPFGFGLSYTTYTYEAPQLSTDTIQLGSAVDLNVTLTNSGSREGEEVVQVYLQDPVSSITRPVKELISFQRVRLKAGETKTLTFSIHTDQLSYYYPEKGQMTEIGEYFFFVGGNSQTNLQANLYVKER